MFHTEVGTRGENNKPWPGQKHCPSTLKGNPAGRSECVQTDPPDLYHRWRNTNNMYQRCVTAFCTSRLRLLVCQQDYVKATGAVGPGRRNGPILLLLISELVRTHGKEETHTAGCT